MLSAPGLWWLFGQSLVDPTPGHGFMLLEVLSSLPFLPSSRRSVCLAPIIVKRSAVTLVGEASCPLLLPFYGLLLL